MEIYLNRNGTGQRTDDITTIGDMVADGVDVVTLEDDYDKVKEYGHTRIPAGRYEIKLRTWGKTHDKYSKRFKDIHVGMLWLQDVPNYKYILIHCGNTSEDTAGCLLVGSKVENKNAISGSSKAYKKIYPVISQRLIAKEKVFINIID